MEKVNPFWLPLGDTHVGNHATDAMELGRRMHEQMEVYMRADIPVLVIDGGDLISGEPLNVGPDCVTIDQDGNRIETDYKIDYAGLEARVLASMLYHEMYSVGPAKVCTVLVLDEAEVALEGYRRAYPKVAALHAEIERKVLTDEPPTVKPAREPKKRDWEQRNRKRRR